MREYEGQEGIRGLVIPGPLARLIETSRWKNPGETALARVAPWFEDRLDFLADPHDMGRQSRALDRLVDDEELARLFHLTRSCSTAGPVDLPWLHVEHAILIAISQYAGDDTAIALDYRIDPEDPRVVGSDIWTVPHQCHWRVIAPTFTVFAEALGLNDPVQKSE